MEEYKDMKTGATVTVSNKDNKFSFPSTSKIIAKKRPPVAKEVPTD